MLTLTLLFAVLFTSGFIGRKPHERAGAGTVTEPVAGGATTPQIHGAASPTSITGSVTLYRGHDAAYWAGRFRHRTKQLQRARGAMHAVIHAGYGNDWLERAFLCIHRYEGSWTDAGAPFWGGLQMDSDFQAHYGGWALKAFGTADHWPISVQISTAIQAYKAGRGFYPWPNTARNCGLL